MGMEDKKLTRRDLLKVSTATTTALAANPMRSLVGSMLLTATKQALSSDSNIDNELCYILYQLPGAPIRTTWLPLNPFGPDSDVITNMNIGTCFEAAESEYTAITYKTVEINGINMPWVWQFYVPTSDGGSRPMADLMDYMLML